MTDELLFQAELILEIKQKQGPAEARRKPLRCRVNSLSESEINFAFAACFGLWTLIPTNTTNTVPVSAPPPLHLLILPLLNRQLSSPDRTSHITIADTYK